MSNTELTYKITIFSEGKIFALEEAIFWKFKIVTVDENETHAIPAKVFHRVLIFDKYRGITTLRFYYMPIDFHHCRASQYFYPAKKSKQFHFSKDSLPRKGHISQRPRGGESQSNFWKICVLSSLMYLLHITNAYQVLFAVYTCLTWANKHH